LPSPDEQVIERIRARDPAAARFRWDVRDLAPREQLYGFGEEPAKAHPLVIQILWNRGLVAPDDVRTFLQGPGTSLHSPWLLRGISEAVERLLRARANGETVAIYGDYDVDGVTSTALLTECLRALGVATIPFVPRRDVEGYGLNHAAIDHLKAEGASLIVAVDCGISGIAEIAHANDTGVDVLVADHHHVPETLPSAAAVINPHQVDCAYPWKDLCAVGIAYKLARALLERAGRDPEEADQWLDLVALGTVADVVPLLGENRALVARGLPVLNRLTRPGLRALALKAGAPQDRITATTIGYTLAPRLNAAGRLADASASLRLLLTRSDDEARDLAELLDSTNRERQRLTDEALAHAREEIRRRREGAPRDFPKLILVASDTYRAGVVGLVASRLVEEFRRPTLVAEHQGEVVRGSARSIDGFHITEALTRCADLLDRYGGHALAAGFNLRRENLDALRRRLEGFAAAEIPDASLQPALRVDAQLHLRLFNASLYDLLRPLEPFGSGNPRPNFVSRRLRVVERRVVGQQSPAHLKLTLADGPSRWEAIGFGMAPKLEHLSDHVDAVYSVERQVWNGRESVQLRLADVQPSVDKT
jgi:single-stranded-DNA-specific exonuclease